MTQMTVSAANALITQCRDEDLLTLLDVSEKTGWNVGRLRPYLKHPALNKFLGARPKPGSKGNGYPPSSLPWFEKLLADANTKKVLPTTLNGWLNELQDNALITQSHNGKASGALVPVGEQIGALVEMPEAQWKVLAELAAALRGLPAPEDRFLTKEEAAAILLCDVKRVGNYVKGIKAGTGCGGIAT